MDRLRIGMIGCGEIAVRMAAAIASSRHAQHVMVMDTQAALAQDLGERRIERICLAAVFLAHQPQSRVGHGCVDSIHMLARQVFSIDFGEWGQ